MKKLIGSLVLSLVLLGIWAVPCFALGLPQGIYYNFDAVGSEHAMDIVWVGHPTTFLTGDELLAGKKETLADVETRCNTKVWDLLMEDILWNQLDPEEEPAFSGVLSPGEEIVFVPQQKLRVWKVWFAIHIYSLDNPLTPESELRFVTRLEKRNNFPGGTTWEQIFLDGWWPE